jgi:hypothetical protein
MNWRINHKWPQEFSIDLKVITFFNDNKNRDVSMLDSYPIVITIILFSRYNTSLCSPTPSPIKQIFSSAGFIRSPTCSKLSDKTENVIFLKSIKTFSK